MDKQLLKAYIRTIVEEEINRLVPQMLAEAVIEVKRANSLNETAVTPVSPVAPVKKSALDRNRLAQLMGIDYDRSSGTITANTSNMNITAHNKVTTMDSAGNKVEISADKVDAGVINAITRDYSAHMKAMKLT